MPYELLENKIKTLPEVAVAEIARYVDKIYERYNNSSSYTKSVEEGISLLHSITGVVSSDVDFTKEKDKVLAEKYGHIA